MLLDTPVCDFGWKAPSFSLKDPDDGKEFSFDDVMGEKGLLVAFICNHCPYVQRIIDPLVSDLKTLQGEGVGVVAIMSNNYETHPDDSPENMKLFAQQHGFTFPYLVDETQEVGRAYDAVCTPDFFGLNKDGELQYRGNNEGLLEAMRLIAETGQGPKDQKPSMGCSIKWK
ncbi:MAG: thioredoxin family protein [Pseudomonadota bacterium]